MQDTGAIQGITDRRAGHFLQGHGRKQQALAETILQDEDVANLSSYIGVDGTNTALNVGRLLITLKPHDDRAASASDVIRRLNREVADVAGISLAMQPVQDLTIDSTVGRAQYQFFLENPSQAAARPPGSRGWCGACSRSPAFEDVSSDLADQGPGTAADHRPADGGALRHHRRRPSTTRFTTPSARESPRPSTPNPTSTG